MVPYAFGSSDGLFNLGSALSFVQVLPPGVYVAMNGQHFPWDARPQEHRRPACSKVPVTLNRVTELQELSVC